MKVSEREREREREISEVREREEGKIGGGMNSGACLSLSVCLPVCLGCVVLRLPYGWLSAQIARADSLAQ